MLSLGLMRKPWVLVLILVVVTLIVAGFLYYPKFKEQADAPSFSKLAYSETVTQNGCKVADGNCHHYYAYKANGSEEDLAQSIVDDFAKQGYKPDMDNGEAVCSNTFVHDDKVVSDSYGFQNDKSELVRVDFLPPNDKLARSNVGNNFGCTNQTGNYVVIVEYLGNQH